VLSDYVPLLIFTVIVLLVVGALVTLSYLLGPSKPTRSKLIPYESGIVPTSPARQRLPMQVRMIGSAEALQCRRRNGQGGVWGTLNDTAFCRI